MKHKAEKFKNILFLSLAGTILLFNFSFKTDIKAVGNEVAVNSRNIYTKHNEIRVSRGLEPLKFSKILNSSAKLKAESMLSTNCWSHFCPEGSSPWEFFDQSGYLYRFAGENLAEGFVNINVLMDAWMNSETHRANIINENFSEIGIAVLNGPFQGNNDNLLVVIHFGDRETLTGEAFLRIDSPQNGSEIKSDLLEINGVGEDINSVNLKINEQIEGSGTLQGGAFTFRVENLELGEYNLQVEGEDSIGERRESNIVNVNILGEELVEEITDDSDFIDSNNEGELTIAPDVKNSVNIGFLVAMAIIFLFDFLVLTRTKILKENRSQSHMHFILMIVTALAIAIGGFGGRIAEGSAV